MEEIKKERSNKARTLTRRLNELINTTKLNGANIEVNEKISQVKNTLEELGEIQDRLLGSIDESDDTATTEIIKWYEGYVQKVNIEISTSRAYLNSIGKSEEPSVPPVKIEKLSVPLFESEPRKYLKWKTTFERYTRYLTDDIKYDYLLTHTYQRKIERFRFQQKNV